MVIFLAACQPTENKSIVFALANSPNSLHPTLATDAVSDRVTDLLYQSLIEFDEQQRPIPNVINWKRRSNKHYELNLQPNLPVYSNGKYPIIEDVLASIKGVLTDPSSPHYAVLKNVHSIKLSSDNGIEIKLTQQDPRFTEKLHIKLAPAAMLADSAQLSKHPVGNGSFTFVKRRSDGGVELQRRSDKQSFIFEVVPDPTMRTLKLLKGDVHILQNDLPFELFAYLKSQARINLTQSKGSTFSYLGFNLEDELTGNIKIRQAIAHAINREPIVEHLFKNYSSKANTVLMKSHWAANTNLKDTRHDPSLSKKLLASLGYNAENPLKLSYKTSTDPFRLRVAAVIQAQLQKVGIKMTISSFEWGTFFADIKAGNFQLYSLSWVGIRSPDIFRYIYHSDSLPPNGANRGRYQSQQMDDWIEAAAALEIDESKPLYQAIQTKAFNDLIYVPLWYEDNLLLTKGINSILPNEQGSYRFLEHAELN